MNDISSTDPLTADLQLLLCTDVTQPLSTSFQFGGSLQKRKNGADLNVKSKMPVSLGYPALTVRSAFDHVGNSRSTILHIYRGEEELGTYQRILSQDMFYLSEPREWKLDVTLGLPWQVFRIARHSQEVSSSASLLWGQNIDSISGLGLLLHRYGSL